MNARVFNFHRRMVRLRLLALLPLLLVTAPGVDAARTWCRTDPVVSIGGQIADIIVMASVDDLPKITGATQVVVVVPIAVNTRLVATDSGFGEVVSFKQSDQLLLTSSLLPVTVRVYVPATSSTEPVKVNFNPRGIGLLSSASGTGTANSWVVLNSGVWALTLIQSPNGTGAVPRLAQRPVMSRTLGCLTMGWPVKTGIALLSLSRPITASTTSRSEPLRVAIRCCPSP